LNVVNWLQGTLLGRVAAVVAIIAVASVGFMMLTGRVNSRYRAIVMVGCFILFGAAIVVSSIQHAAGGV
jgi:type IV secretion system protein VirB2